MSVLYLAGCIFSVSPGRSSFPSLQERALDEVVKSPPDAVIELFQPLHDPSLGAGASSFPAFASPVRVRDHETGRVTEYRWSQRSFGTWTPERERQYNLFLLRSRFLWPGTFDDTTGLSDVAALYQRARTRDAHSNYVDSAGAAEARRRLFSTTQPKTIGIQVRVNDAGDTVSLRLVAPGSPAHRAGLRQGMPVLAVGDSVVTGDSAFARFARFIALDTVGPVRMTVGASGGPLTAVMVREDVNFPTVIVDSLGGVGYIAVLSFTSSTIGGGTTRDEFRKALDATRGFASIVLDLRGNGGGSLGIALQMADDVMDGGVIIRLVDTKFEGAPVRYESTFRARAGGRGAGREFVLLADSGTASAAEILVAALREGLNAPQVGTRTYGKGVGQAVFETPGGGLALVTYSRVLTSSGLDYRDVGLQPTLPSSLPPDAMLAYAAGVVSPEGLAKSAGPDDIKARAHASVLEWNRSQALRTGGGGGWTVNSE